MLSVTNKQKKGEKKTIYETKQEINMFSPLKKIILTNAMMKSLLHMQSYNIINGIFFLHFT